MSSGARVGAASARRPRFACTVAWTWRSPLRFARVRTPPDPPPDRPAPRRRPPVRGRPVRAGPRRRQPAPERPPDQRARRDGPRALARAGHRVRGPARRAAARVHPARGAVRPRRRQHDDRRASWPRSSAARRRRRAGWWTASCGAGSSSGTTRPTTVASGPLRLTPRGQALLRVVDRARADQFLAAVRPLPTAERALVAMGVAALATHAITRRGRLIRAPRD